MSLGRIQRLFVHSKCRGLKYPFIDIKRFPIADNKVDWEVEFPEYSPEYYDSPVLNGKPWADPVDPEKLAFNSLDLNVDRRSHCGQYQLLENYPLNPYGRTGIKGRGVLGRWGPNHAADPIVSRWRRSDGGEIIKDLSTGKNILQMCIIQRQDCGEFALPGGMVDPGESVSQTLKREFAEEALNSNDSEVSQKNTNEFFEAKNGVEVYKNYVDDPRNTDNAWMETVAVNFHDDTGDQVGRFKLCAGDDAAHVQWMDVHKGIKFYASHGMFIASVVKRLDGHW